ncbi:MAG: response regulator [Desulfatiglandales bacterium]
MVTILILDDDASIRFLYEEELRDEGYDVVSENGEADIDDLVLQKRPDLILLDLKLGEASGLDVLKKLRKENGTMPVILCTAYTISSQQAVAMGADDVVSKSSDLSDLKVKIRKIISSAN